jgi:hypothetical protein
MRNYTTVHPRFWTLMSSTGTELRQLGAEATLTALYLITCPNSNAIGLYYLSPSRVSEELGLPVERVREILEAVCRTGFAQYSQGDSVVWIPRMAHYQIGESLSKGDRRVAWARKELKKFEGSTFHRAFLERYGEAYHLASPQPRAPIQLLRKGSVASGGQPSRVGSPPPSHERLQRAVALSEMLEKASRES